MLADNGIELLDLHFSGHIALVFGCCIKMAGTGTGNQSDFIAHPIPSLYFFAAFTHIGKHGIDAHLVDDTHAIAGDAQAHPAIFTFDPEPVVMKVRVEASF
jgi:hypothetical protein